MKFKNIAIGCALLFLILFIVFHFSYSYGHMDGFETGKDNVVFIIPTTSRDRNYMNIYDTPIMKTLYPSLKKIDVAKYTFVVGMDDDDVFFNENIDELKKALPDNFHFHFFNNFDKSYVCIVNQLGATAIEKYNADYIYVFADDLTIYTLDFIDGFIKYFKENDNLALGYGIDENRQNLCTHPFINKNHVIRLGYLYPPAIKNWFCDDWIHQLYAKLNRIVKTESPVFTNLNDLPRYDIVAIEPILLNKLVDDAASTLNANNP
jgi:hypothetical protein